MARELDPEDEPGNCFVSYVTVDVDAYAKEHFEKAVKKTLTIPAWLNKLAMENNVNFSKVLQEVVEGIAIAKAKGKKLGRREIQVDDDKLISLYNQWKDGEILQKKIMKDCKMSRTTLHKHITRLKKENRIK